VVAEVDDVTKLADLGKRQISESDELRKVTKSAWLQPAAPQGVDANLKHSNKLCARTVSDTNFAWPCHELPQLVDEDSATGSPMSASAQAAALHLVRSKTTDSVRSSMNSSFDSLARPGVLAERIWNIMSNDDDSPEATWWARLWVCFVLLSVLFTLTQALEPPLMSVVGAAVVETVIDALFGLELLVRYATAPDMKHFVTDPFILVDFVSVLPIVPRALVGVTLPRHLDSRNVPVLLLVCGVPMLRLAKVLRWTGVQMSLFERVLASTMETLRFLALCGSLMILNFAFWIFLVEPRESVDTYWRAIWLVIVTMTTVGYGDVTVETTEGHVVVTILIACSVLFMAMPIGVLGNAFASAWSERDLIMLINQTRRRLAQWGHTPSDLPQFFLRYDADGDGELSLDEFIHMMTALKVTLKGDRMIELFEVFDRDHGGSVDEKEFMLKVFPKTFFEIVQREKEEKEERERQDRANKKQARQEERHRNAKIEQWRGS
jgi:voltage-gated potassium channel